MTATGVSPYGIADIMDHEGIVPYRYKDSVGVDTFGIGHTAKAGAPDPKTIPFGVERPLSEVVETFRRDLATFEKRVAKTITVPLKQTQRDALVSFDLNTGRIHNATLGTLVNARKWAEAAAEFMQWKKPPEIIKRRQKEQALFRDGTYSSGGFANVYPADEKGRVLWKKGRRVNVMPVISGILAANGKDAEAKAETQKGAASGAGAAGAGSATLPELPSDGFMLRVFLIGLAVALVAAATAFLVRAGRKRKQAKAISDRAALHLETELVGAPTVEGEPNK